MAVVGDILTSPESGMKRIDGTNINIIYNGTWATDNSDATKYNNTNTVSTTIGDSIEFYFYGTKFVIFDTLYKNRSNQISVEIDGVVDGTYSGNSSTTAHQVAVYVKEGLDLEIHCVKITNNSSTSNTSMGIDCIDIDEDGYMLYCDETTGKLYYDVTPIMTSNTTPDGYESSASSNYTDSISYSAYRLFDGINSAKSTGWASKSGLVTNQWVQLKGINELVDTILITTTYNGQKEAPCNFDIQGSNDETSWDTIKSFTNINDWKSGFDTKLFKLSNLNKYLYYRIYIYDTNGADATAGVCSMGEIRYLLAVDTPFYLIQDNNNNKIYNYDEVQNQLIEVTDTSILKEDALKNICIYDLSKVIPLLDTLSDDLTILCNNDKKIIAKCIKSTKELIIGKNSFSTKIARNIDYFQLDENATAKIIFSIDDGVTWKTYNSSTNSFEDLSISIPVDKDYSDFTEEEKIAWEEAKEVVYNQGIDSSILNTIDFNELNAEKIRFGYILTATDAETMDRMTNLIWKFDSKGVMEVVDGDKVKQQLFYGGVKLISNIDADMLKINITYEGIR